MVNRTNITGRNPVTNTGIYFKWYINIKWFILTQPNQLLL